jgi:hypothetical protein
VAATGAAGSTAVVLMGAQSATGRDAWFAASTSALLSQVVQ